MKSGAMRSTQTGKGFVPILLLITAAVIIVVLLATQLNKSYKNPASSPAATSGTEATPAEKGVVEVMLSPADVSAAVNGTVSLIVNIDTKTEKVSAAEVHVSYDPDYLEATTIKNGTFLPVVLTPSEIKANTASIVVGANPTTPMQGTGTLATVTFKAKKVGSTQVTVDKTQVAAIGKNSNVLGPTVNASVTVK